VLLLGLTTRPAAAVSFFILINLAIGGYYDASLLPFFLLDIIFLLWPSGQWLDLDHWLSGRTPPNGPFLSLPISEFYTP
jgi:thiosulfate dehydrogenase [quinone] large subunit